MNWDFLPLDEYELGMLRSLLRRFCATELDQWEMWKTMTPDGLAFITIMRMTESDPDAYLNLDE